MIPDADRWNHNVHYHSVITSALPVGCSRVLDVGCGDGTLTRQLARLQLLVVGLDRDEPSVRRASAESTDGHAQYIVADVLNAPFLRSTFDAVLSVAALHHVDAEQGLIAMAGMLRPGGNLVVVGLARGRRPRDLPREMAAVVASRLIRLRREYWEVEAPTVWPPPLTYPQMKALTERLLPGARFRRHLFWRYSIVWIKPR